MKSLLIDATEDTPNVDFNSETGILSISNRSFPEDPSRFYKPIIDWMEEYAASPNDFTEINFRFDYFNTSSSKQVFKLLLIMEEISQANKVAINWFYRKEDTDMLSTGEIFSKLVDVPISIIEE